MGDGDRRGWHVPTRFAKTVDRIWLLTAAGIQGGSDRSTIYRRDFAPEPAPPSTPRLRPPDTGGGPRRSIPLASIAVLLTVMGAMAITAATLTCRRAPPTR